MTDADAAAKKREIGCGPLVPSEKVIDQRHDWEHHETRCHEHQIGECIAGHDNLIKKRRHGQHEEQGNDCHPAFRCRDGRADKMPHSKPQDGRSDFECIDKVSCPVHRLKTAAAASKRQYRRSSEADQPSHDPNEACECEKQEWIREPNSHYEGETVPVKRVAP